MSDDEDEVYSIQESDAYSYQDLAIYQYSDGEEDETPAQQRSAPNLEDEDDDDEDGEWNQWNDYDNDSYVMHTQSDNDDDIDLYQFSDEDLIPEEPDKEWIVAALLNQRRDYENLELMLQSLEDFGRLMEAIQLNHIVRNVTIYESFFDALPTDVEKTILAETICRIQNLEQLKVYFHSSYFVGPLEQIRPPLLKRLCLMFFPERPSKETLASLTRILKDGREQVNEEETTITSPPTLLPSATAEPPPSVLESLSLRCTVMDDDFIQAIALGMQVNPTLKILSFWGNKDCVTEKGARDSAKIDFYLRLNQCKIRDLHLLVNATPSEFLDKIVNERESIDLVFYLLQTNPSFLSYSSCL